MRRVWRQDLPEETRLWLQTCKQQGLNWKNARQAPEMQLVLSRLQHMAGKRQRCMYCLDSEGGDIEHFWPQSDYPGRRFNWRNLLLCCSICGRHKGDRFPLAGKKPLLIDPSKENPWLYLDFNPATGALTARYDANSGQVLAKGRETVQALKLNMREGIQEGQRKSWQKLIKSTEAYLDHPDAMLETTINAWLDDLQEADDYDLLSWVVSGNGWRQALFVRLSQEYPASWQALCARNQSNLK